MRQANGRTPYKLENPIENGKETIDTLHFRELQLGDLADISIRLGGDGAQIDGKMIMMLVGNLCGQPDKVVKQIRGRDMMEVGKIALGFIAAVLPTGETPSP